ncbi:MAG: signal peptidase II [Pygmaiobacter massiliensis]|nr:signal peptidase II [Pygmaiobacter massiliensis]
MLLPILSILALVALDQLTKYLATCYLAPVGSAPFLPGIMELRYVLNDGMAFSMLSGARWLLIAVTTVAMAIMLFYLLHERKKLSRLEAFSLVLIIGGGIGNLIDRVRFGYVVDFFATTFVDFAIFNVADCFVTVGVVLLMASILFQEFCKNKKSAALGEKKPCGEDEVSPQPQNCPQEKSDG